MQQLLLLVAFLLPAGAGADQPSCEFNEHRGKIIGGQEAIPHSHPYMAYLLTRTPRGLGTCGGFLVREDFVMTSARCWGSRMRVILGAHNIRRQERTQQSILVLRAIRHPRYNQQNNLNDLMLLQLENRARRNQFVRPVALPQSQITLSPGSLCTVAGWGLVSQRRRTNTLRDVQLSVQRDQECINYFDTFDSQRQICVGDQFEGKTTFLGDTGGPLVCNNVAQGIVSYGGSFGAPPTVFTRIARFLPWINRTMSQFNQKGAH